MNNFKEKIKDMSKSKEKTYNCRNLRLIEDRKDGNIFICKTEFLGLIEEHIGKMGANNIEDGTQVVEYTITEGPAGRTVFGEYTDNECNKEKLLYRFDDVWYKTRGRHLSLDQQLTRSELLNLKKEIGKKLKEGKFDCIYSIKCKDAIPKKVKFEGTKYFATYIEDEGTVTFEMINDDSIELKKDGTDLLIRIANEEIVVKGYYASSIEARIEQFEESNFGIEEIEGMKFSNVKNLNGYNQAKFTKEACENIIRTYEKGKITEGR